MTDFYSEYYQCPKCLGKIKKEGSLPKNHDYIFSDGAYFFNEFGELEFDSLLHCPSCAHYFWAHPDLYVGASEPYHEFDESKATEIPEKIREEINCFSLKETFEYSSNFDYYTLIHDNIRYIKLLLESGMGNNKNNELYLRIKLMWAYNDLRRDKLLQQSFLRHIKRHFNFGKKNNDSSLYKNLKKEYRDNLIRISELLEDEESFLTVDINRSIGNFSLAKKILKNIEKTQNNNPDYYEYFAVVETAFDELNREIFDMTVKKYRKAIKKKYTEPFMITPII